MQCQANGQSCGTDKRDKRGRLNPEPAQNKYSRNRQDCVSGQRPQERKQRVVKFFMLQPNPYDAPLEKSGQPQGKNRDGQRGTQVDNEIQRLVG